MTKPAKLRLHINHRDAEGNGRHLLERWYCTVTAYNAQTAIKLSRWWPKKDEAIEAATIMARAIGLPEFEIINEHRECFVMQVDEWMSPRDLAQLVHDMATVIDDMMTSTGGALIVQDYARLNDVLMREATLTRQETSK